MSPRGTSRQVKPQPKHTKGKKRHQRPTRTQKLGGNKSQRLQAARTGPLPHLTPPCSCPCPTPSIMPPVTVSVTVQDSVLSAATGVTVPVSPETPKAPPGPAIPPGH